MNSYIEMDDDYNVQKVYGTISVYYGSSYDGYDAKFHEVIGDTKFTIGDIFNSNDGSYYTFEYGEYC